jgi:hypothetical protein
MLPREYMDKNTSLSRVRPRLTAVQPWKIADGRYIPYSTPMSKSNGLGNIEQSSLPIVVKFPLLFLFEFPITGGQICIR